MYTYAYSNYIYIYLKVYVYVFTGDRGKLRIGNLAVTFYYPDVIIHR